MRRAFAGLVVVILITMSSIPRPWACGACIPLTRSGQELLGKAFDLEGLRWVNPRSGVPFELEGQVTLVRWFTDRCQFCARSVPAVVQLGEEFGKRGFQTVLVYHPKPPAPVRDRDATKAAANLGYRGPLAVDADWSVLSRVYLAKHPEGATSVSFLLDKSGVVRYVHPGPEFGPTAEPDLKQVNQDYEDIKAAIEILLTESRDR